jgi:hypothetical protein
MVQAASSIYTRWTTATPNQTQMLMITGAWSCWCLPRSVLCFLLPSELLLP